MSTDGGKEEILIKIDYPYLQYLYQSNPSIMVPAWSVWIVSPDQKNSVDCAVLQQRIKYTQLSWNILSMFDWQ